MVDLKINNLYGAFRYRPYLWQAAMRRFHPLSLDTRTEIFEPKKARNYRNVEGSKRCFRSDTPGETGMARSFRATTDP
jgi:hypothetical protein